MLYYSKQKGQPDVLRHGEEDSGRSGNKTKRVEHEIMSLCKRGRSVERPAVRIPGADEHSVVHRCSGAGSRHARTNPPQNSMPPQKLARCGTVPSSAVRSEGDPTNNPCFPFVRQNATPPFVRQNATCPLLTIAFTFTIVTLFPATGLFPCPPCNLPCQRVY